MGHGAYNPGEYGSFRMAPIGRAHRWTGTLLGASMWFFMMYRAKQDGAALLVGDAEMAGLSLMSMINDRCEIAYARVYLTLGSMVITVMTTAAAAAKNTTSTRAVDRLYRGGCCMDNISLQSLLDERSFYSLL